MAQQVPTWLDCDPGHDDAFAILLATYHPSISLLGISTVHGNASLANTTRNTLSLLTLFNKTSIPVYSGASEALIRPALHAPDIHGASGIDGTTLLPEPTAVAQEGDAVEAMAKAVLATEKETAWIVGTGALTNIARAFQLFPELVEHVKGVSIMGGAIGGGFTNAKLGKVGGAERVGNWSEWAEFNILIDPEASSFLLSHPVLSTKIALIPLDVTHLVLGTKDVQSMLLKADVLGKKSSVPRQCLVDLLTFFAKTYSEVFGLDEGPPLHDPLAVAVILDGISGAEIPFFDHEAGQQGRRERFEVKVVTEGSHEDAQKGAQTGRTIVKLLPEGQEGVKIPRSLDIVRFWAVIDSCLEKADAAMS